MYTDVSVCDCTRRGGGTNTVRESALKVDSERKIPLGTGESNLLQRDAGPMLYQLSYIPTPVEGSGVGEGHGGGERNVQMPLAAMAPK